MSALSTSSPPRRWSAGRLSFLLIGFVSFLLLFLILEQFGSQVIGKPVLLPLTLVKDVPLPSVIPDKFIPDVKVFPAHETPLTPGVSVRFDHFDFQSLDPKTGLLFLAHSGPNPDKLQGLVNPNFDAAKDTAVDGHVLVFDTKTNTLVNRVDIPQVAGVVTAPDLGRVYVADAQDNKVVMIDEKTLHTTDIQLGDLESPDAIEYDPDDHKVFVSDPGTPADNATNVNLDNQNLSVIDTVTNKVTKINLGHMPKLATEHADLLKFGFDVGHNHYDPGLRRVFVTSQQLTDQGVANPLTPPAGTGELISIDPARQSIVARLQLPTSCGTPHGFNINQQEQIGYIVCTDLDPDQNLIPRLLRVDLKALKVISDPSLPLSVKPDIVTIDMAVHALFVGCNGSISIFDIAGRSITPHGSFVVGKGTHTLSINEQTQLLYVPLPDAGGRPVLRILKYNPNAFV